MADNRIYRLWGMVVIAGVIVLLISAIVSFRYEGDTDAEPLRVFCGAASKPAMEECAISFEKKTGIRVELQFGGSGTMLSKLKMAKRGDILIAGSPDYMAKAERQGIVDPGKVKILAYLVPAILVQKENPRGIESLDDLTGPGIAVGIGNPQAVCVGLYAIEVLEKSGLLEKVGKNVIVHAESCSKTAALVAMKTVDAIVGWRVFSKWNPGAIDAVLLKPDKLPRLAYIPAGICTTSRDHERAEKFVGFLTSAEGSQIFRKWGYITTEQEARKFAPNAQIGGEYELPDDYRNLAR